MGCPQLGLARDANLSDGCASDLGCFSSLFQPDIIPGCRSWTDWRTVSKVEEFDKLIANKNAMNKTLCIYLCVYSFVSFIK